jgi:hypothetical protein
MALQNHIQRSGSPERRTADERRGEARAFEEADGSRNEERAFKKAELRAEAAARIKNIPPSCLLSRKVKGPSSPPRDQLHHASDRRGDHDKRTRTALEYM